MSVELRFETRWNSDTSLADRLDLFAEERFTGDRFQGHEHRRAIQDETFTDGQMNNQCSGHQRHQLVHFLRHLIRIHIGIRGDHSVLPRAVHSLEIGFHPAMTLRPEKILQ